MRTLGSGRLAALFVGDLEQRLRGLLADRDVVSNADGTPRMSYLSHPAQSHASRVCCDGARPARSRKIAADDARGNVTAAGPRKGRPNALISQYDKWVIHFTAT